MVNKEPENAFDTKKEYPIFESKNHKVPELLLTLFLEYVQFHETNDLSDSDNICETYSE